MGNNDVALITIQTESDLRKVQRQQIQGLQRTQGFLIGAACTLEKALDSTELDDEARRLVNAAFFQLQQVQNETAQLHSMIDALTLNGVSHE
ncbi:conserved hypothetical protein [Vibrio crassostreae]|nr:conserved hypothetical protein [Vibrio crassostreae]